MKKKLVIGLSIAGIAALAIGNSLAYLSDEKTNANVMTVGNVKIEQLEYERVLCTEEKCNSKWVSTGKEDKYGYTPDQVQKFTQNKSLSPAVFKDGKIKWDDRVENHQQSWGQIEAPGSSKLFDDSVRNALDKFVFVKNVGKKDAYIRTWFAFEQGSIPADRFEKVIATSGDAVHWDWETVATDVKIGGNEYVIAKATYLGPTSNPTGILTPDATTYPSLLQVYMYPSATNEDVEDIDGNNNGTYDILVVSQAVQTDGFDAAEEALTAAFTDEHPWNDLTIAQVNDEVSTSLDGDLYLIDRPFYNEIDNSEEVVIDGNGHTVYQEVSSYDKFEWPGGNRTTMGNFYASTNGAQITVKNITFKGVSQGNQAGYWIGDGLNFNTKFENVNIIDLEVPAYTADQNDDNVKDDKIRAIGNGLLSYGTLTLDNVKIIGTKKSSLETSKVDEIYDLVVINGKVNINDSKLGKVRIWNHVTDIEITGNTVIDSIEFTTTKSKLTKLKNLKVDSNVTIKKVIITKWEQGEEISRQVMTYEEWLNS